MAISITAYGPSTTRRFASLRKAARTLSGKGTDGIRNRITRRVRAGGGYVGNTYVSKSKTVR